MLLSPRLWAPVYRAVATKLILLYCCGRCGQRPGARLADAILGAAAQFLRSSTCRTPSAHGHADRARCLGRFGPARGITQRHRALSPVADADDDSGSRSDRAGQAKIELAKQAERAGRLPGHFDPAG